MVKIEVSTVISRPVEEVFAYLSDISNWPEWNSLTLEASASETRVRVGPKVRQVTRFLGRRIEGTGEITEHEPNRKITLESNEPFPTTLTMRFEAADEGTRLVAAGEAEPGGFFKLGEPILARVARHQFQAQLETLKELLEAKVPARSGS